MPTSYFSPSKPCPYQFWDKMYDFLVIYSVFCTFSDFLGSPPLQGLWRHLVGLTYLKKKIICQFIKPIKFLNFCKKIEFKIFRTLWDIKKTTSNPYRFFYREMGVSRPCYLVVRVRVYLKHTLLSWCWSQQPTEKAV